MKTVSFRLFSLILAVAAFCAVPDVYAREFWLGADISGVSADEAHGREFFDAQGNPTDIFSLMADYDINAIRLRVWVNPKDGFCSPSDVVEMARRAQSEGMPLMIDFHYSDWWADPGKQNIPEQWKDMGVDEMAQEVYEHTRSTLETMQSQGMDVRWVQVGNETSHGMLWPIGKFEDNPENYAMLTQAGINAVRDVYPDAQVIIHLDNGYDSALYDRVFDSLSENGIKWDIIGMSLYPYWAREGGYSDDEMKVLADCVNNILHVKEKYGTDVMITEVGVDAREPEKGYEFMTRMFDRMINDTKGACVGVFYWAPEINADAPYHLGAFSNDRPTKIMDSFTYAAQKLR